MLPRPPLSLAVGAVPAIKPLIGRAFFFLIVGAVSACEPRRVGPLTLHPLSPAGRHLRHAVAAGVAGRGHAVCPSGRGHALQPHQENGGWQRARVRGAWAWTLEFVGETAREGERAVPHAKHGSTPGAIRRPYVFTTPPSPVPLALPHTCPLCRLPSPLLIHYPSAPAACRRWR
jgi:hypothetical protein